MVDYRLGFHRFPDRAPVRICNIVTASPPIEPRIVELPPVVQAQLDAPAPQRRGWLTTIAPAYLGVFVWFPFLDPLGVGASGSVGLAGRILSAVLAVVCCYGLLYHAPAMLGWRTGRRLAVVASEPLGAEGAEWITGVLYGLFAAVWCAVSIYYSVRLTLLGLISWTLLDPTLVAPWNLGAVKLESPLVLTALAFWLFIIAAANGLRLMNVIAALMNVYAPVAAALLGLTAAWTLIGSSASDLAETRPSGDSPGAFGLFDPRVFQLVFGYFAFAGLMGVEWGSAVESRKDVRLGGWLGILASGAFAVAAGLVLAAGDPGGSGQVVGGVAWEIPVGSIQGAFIRRIGGSLGAWAAGALLLLFGLASLAPACYSSKVFADRFRGHWDPLRGWLGTVLGYGLIFALMAVSLAARLEPIFALGGALFAPAAGILAVEAMANRGLERCVRPGWRGVGVAAWLVGGLVGLAPMLGEAAGAPWLESVQPASLLAFATAAAVYGVSMLFAAKPPAVTDPGSDVSGAP